MGYVIPLHSRNSARHGPVLHLGTLRHLSGMSLDEFAAAIADEAGEPVPRSVYLAYEERDPPAAIVSAACRIVARTSASQGDGVRVFSAIDRDRLSFALRCSRPIDPDLLGQMESAHEWLNARSEIEPPRLVKPDLRSWLDVLQDLLQHNQVGPTGLRIRSMAARAANHLGYLSFRDLRRAEAATYYSQTASLANEARDSHELAILLLRKQRLVAATDGPRAAFDLVESIGQLLNPNSPSGITAWRWGEMARLEALLGNELGARRYLDFALSAADRDPHRLNLFAADKDSRWLQRRPAYVALHLGYADEAIEILEQNRRGSDPTFVRETIWNSVELADAWAIQGELGNAYDCINGALTMAVATEDIRAVAFIRNVRTKRLTRWQGDSRIKRLDDYLRAVSIGWSHL